MFQLVLCVSCYSLIVGACCCKPLDGQKERVATSPHLIVNKFSNSNINLQHGNKQKLGCKILRGLGERGSSKQ